MVLVPWPREAHRREELAREGLARLLLVEAESPAPPVIDPLEDWIRLPAPDADVRARVETLLARIRENSSDMPVLDGNGVLRFDGRRVILPSLEQRLTSALLDRFEAVVSRESLERAGWPDGIASRNALDAYIVRLRRRLAPLGLVIRTVRSRGYLLENGRG